MNFIEVTTDMGSKRATKRLNEFFLLLEDDLANRTVEEGYQAFSVARQRERAKKRARLGDSTLTQKAIDDFRVVNSEVGHCIIDLPPSVADNARAFIRMALERYSASASELNIQVTLDRVHLLELWGFGPGASFDTKGTHAALKIEQAWTTTSLSEPEVIRLRRNHPYLSARDGIEGRPFIRQVEGSQLRTVPKNEEKERTIAIEPLGNMCLQLAAGRYLEGALRLVGLDIRNQQPKNKKMAQAASIDGSLCTIDLSAASDRIHPDLVRLLLPPEWYELLMSLRCQRTRLPNGEWVDLNMISTMGNGFTFPLMTMLIVALIYGFRSQEPGSPNLWINWNNTCVFGDDIILPVHEYRGFTEILRRSGFVVNDDKSYFEGPFRESCGGDYWCGMDVTPFYIESLECDAEIYVALNKMTEWGGKVGILPYQATLFLLRELEHGLCFVPEWEQPTAGLRCTQVPRRYWKYQPEIPRVQLRSEFFLMTLACQGYVTGGADTPYALSLDVGPQQPRKGAERANEVTYSPRTVKVRWRRVRSRMPNGYLDGRDSCFRSSSVSSHGDYVAWLGSVVAPSSGQDS